MDEYVAEDQQRHVRHPPIPVPDSESPFESPDREAVFFTVLDEVQTAEIVPPHYGLKEAEWDNGAYPTTQEIPLGRGGRRVEIELPFAVWWKRAVFWAQGHRILTEMLMNSDL